MLFTPNTGLSTTIAEVSKYLEFSSSVRSFVNRAGSLLGLFPPQSQKIIMDSGDSFYFIPTPTCGDIHNNYFNIWKQHIFPAEGEVPKK